LPPYGHVKTLYSLLALNLWAEAFRLFSRGREREVPVKLFL
jgi:hypothetical protein